MHQACKGPIIFLLNSICTSPFSYQCNRDSYLLATAASSPSLHSHVLLCNMLGGRRVPGALLYSLILFLLHQSFLGSHDPPRRGGCISGYRYTVWAQTVLEEKGMCKWSQPSDRRRGFRYQSQRQERKTLFRSNTEHGVIWVKHYWKLYHSWNYVFSSFKQPI